MAPSCGYIYVGDGCWRQNVLMTTLGYCHIDEAVDIILEII